MSKGGEAGSLGWRELSVGEEVRRVRMVAGTLKCDSTPGTEGTWRSACTLIC